MERPGLSLDEARRIALDDSLSAHQRSRVVVVGCGNLLRGDDAVGPILIRHLWEEGVPDTITIVDGGTAGMDVAFKMRGAERVVIIDAATTGAEPGTIYRVPGEELEDLPSLDGLHMHQFRWDHALSFGRWLLGDDYPNDITVFLIEIESTDPGAPLTERVESSMHQVKALVRELFPTGGEEPAEADSEAALTVEFTDDGSLRIDADLAARHFPNDALVATSRDDELWLLPLVGPENGGLLLKQRTAAGDRSTLIWEALPPGVRPVGERAAIWDEGNGALRVDLERTDR